jgi:hypothetical protein
MFGIRLTLVVMVLGVAGVGSAPSMEAEHRDRTGTTPGGYLPLAPQPQLISRVAGAVCMEAERAGFALRLALTPRDSRR